MLTQKLKSNFTEDQIKTLDELKREPGWGIVANLAKNILKSARLENVDIKLPADEYKVECLSYLKAKNMFKQIFSDVDAILYVNKKNKINYE